MKKIYKVLIVSFVLLCSLFLARSINIAASTTQATVSVGANSSLLNFYNPNGDNDYVVISNSRVHIKDLSQKINSCSRYNNIYYTNPYYQHYRVKYPYTYFTAESPIVAMVDEN